MGIIRSTIVILLCLVNISSIFSQEKISAIETGYADYLFDTGWKFNKGGLQTGSHPDFDDSGWRTVDLPHDWSIEDIAGTSSPFDSSAVGQRSSAFTHGGTAWYRKSFVIDKDAMNKRMYIQFDGVYMNAEVWLNGQKLGSNPYGYSSFWFDISKVVKIGERNIIAVKVMNEGENTRWYSGSGIYRHVWLTFKAPVHVAHWRTYITTPSVNTNSASIHARYEIRNDHDKQNEVRVQTLLLAPNGKEVARTESKKNVAASGTSVFEYDLIVNTPQLWSIEKPNLYIAKTIVFVDDQPTDEVATPIGIRTISFDTQKGFQLNGKSLELKGGCAHHDHGPLGAKSFDRAEERKVALLKANGFNAIRTSHNPPSPAFLDACDRLGMLVIDEAFDMWRVEKNPFDYHLYFDSHWKRDIESMLYRDRNHPSIIMWSIGNEIPAMNEPQTVDVAKMLADHVRSLDPTRPVTAAVNDIGKGKDPFFSQLDVAGYNYGINFAWNEGPNENKYETDHAREPKRIMYGSESFPLKMFDYWMAAKDNSWVIGDFVWTAVDYLGEAGIGYIGFPQVKRFYPWAAAYCGDIDICGWKRPQSFYRDALWNDSPALSIFVKNPTPTFEENPARASWSNWQFLDVWPSWTWPGYDGRSMEVQVYANYDRVELFINGKSLGQKITNRDTKYTATWNVPYQPGTLKAIGFHGKKKSAPVILATASEATKIKMSPDRMALNANGQDLSYVTIELVDENGVLDPGSDDLVMFSIEGPGTIVGVGNANPVSDESFVKPQRKAWKGKCLVIVKSGKTPGNIILRATSGEMKSSTAINVH